MPKRNNDLPPELGNVHSIKFGSGVLGKTAPVVCLAEIVALAAAWKMAERDPELAVFLVLVAVGLAAAYAAFCSWYGIRHPGPALLEGSHLLRYRELSLRTNDPLIIDSVAAPTSNGPPPHVGAGGENV